MRRRVTVAALGLMAVTAWLALAAPAMAVNASFSAYSSPDGAHLFFKTADKLTADDNSTTDPDIFDRSGGTTSLVSAGSGGGVLSDTNFVGSSTDSSRVFYATGERKVAADTDLQFDIYERTGGVNNLVSAGQINGNGSFGATFRGASDDGTRVFFTTQEPLVATDTDASFDIYQRSGGTTTLVSAGQINGNGAFSPTFGGASADGTRVFFTTTEPLVAADTDTAPDTYERSGGTTTLVSAGQINGNGPQSSTFSASSADGTRVLFTTFEQLVPADSDNSGDVYQRSAGTTSLVSAGQINGNGANSVTFRGASDDATRVYFTTTEQLVAGDTDSSSDIYLRDSGATTQVSTGPTDPDGAVDPTFNATIPDGSKAYFTTSEQLTSSDDDTQLDIYQFSGGTTTLLARGATSSGGELLSFGDGPFDTIFEGVSDDGTDVYFETAERMALEDGDEVTDVYRTSTGGSTSQISRGAINGQGGFPAHYAGNSADGALAAFTTFEQLTTADIDSDRDVYERTPSSTRLVSIETIPPQTAINGGAPDGGATHNRTPVFGLSSSEAGSTFQCSVDGFGFSSCTNPEVLDPLADGAHTFAVQATDVAGNTDTSPASRSFTVDTIPPDASIDSGPTGPTKDTTPTFGFSADETAVFACRVDSDSYAPCSGPGDVHTPSALSQGSHTFHVRARDAAGNTSFASASFRVDTTAPNTVIDDVVVNSSTRKAQVFFRGTDAGSSPNSLTFKCRLDSAPLFQPCTSPKAFKSLSPGAHTVTVRAFDAAGNPDPTPATKPFSV
jgi:Bacterial Ig-like domain